MSYPPPPEQPQYGYQPQLPPPDHPRAMTAMILGILGLVLCQLVGPFAWKIGGQAMREIDASGGQLGGRGLAQAGYILGIVATVLLIVAVALFAVFAIIAIIAAAASA